MLISAAEIFPLNVVLKFKAHVAGGVMAFYSLFMLRVQLAIDLNPYRRII